MADPVDPAYEGLFRPGSAPVDDAPRIAAPTTSTPPGDADEIDLTSGAVRVYRSQGVLGHDEALLAIPIGSRLRTLVRSSAEPDDLPLAASAPAAVAVITAEPAPVDVAPSLAATLGAGRGVDPIDDGPDAGSMLGSMVIPGFVAWLIIGIATLVVAFINAIVGDGHLGWPTGLTLLLTTLYCALVLQRRDLGIAIFAPPLVYLLAALTAGQFFLGAAGGGLLNRAAELFFLLGANWGWILGAVLGAVIITIIRRALRR